MAGRSKPPHPHPSTIITTTINITLLLPHLLVFLLQQVPISLQEMNPNGGGGGGGDAPTLTYPCPHPRDEGPPPSPDLIPKLPEQFVMHVQAQLVQKQTTMEAIEVYDYPKSRAAISITSNNQTVTSIFSYEAGERLDILSNGSCVTRNLSEASFDVFGFTELKEAGRPQIMPVADVFRWGDKFKKVFIGEESVRGVSVYHWQSCQTMERDGVTRAAFLIDYYFSKPGFTTATGDSMIPVRTVINGTAINVDSRGTAIPGTHNFSHIYDFSFFRPGPVEDESLFEVPRGTVCKRRLSKTLPQLPDQFSLSMEVQVGGRGHPPRTERMLFDYDFGLIQTERFAPRGTGERFGLTELTIVEDYNNHVQYVIDSYDGNCSVSPLPEGLSTSEGGSGQQITMKHAQELLKYGHRDFKYQGQRLLRDMKVDVWADSTEDGMVQEVYFLADWPTAHLRSKLRSLSSDLDLSRMNVLVGTYLLNTSAIRSQLGPFFQLFQDKALKPWGDRWQSHRFQRTYSSSSSSSSSLPEPGDLLRLRMAKRRMHWDSARMHFPDANEKMINIFNYLPLHMDMSAFDISTCYKQKARAMYIFFAVEGTYASVVTDQRYLFLSAVRSTVAIAAGVSMLRVTNVNVWQDVVSSKLSVLFSLLQPPPVFSRDQRPQLSCQQALINLRQKVQEGLVIRIKHPIRKHELRVLPNSVQNWGSPDDMWRRVLGPGAKTGAWKKGGGGAAAGSGQQNANSAPVKAPGDGAPSSPPSSSSSSSGYTSGQFGGMAFAMLVLGVVVGVGGLYLVLRRLRPDIHLLPYQQSK